MPCRALAVPAMLALLFATANGDGQAPLTIVPAEVAAAHGAACLDGSSPGYYFTPATSNAKATSWVLYFKGGGWCYDEASCAERSVGELGSNAHFPATFGFPEGPVGYEAATNPTFNAFNRVVLWYCDGGSFSGDRAGTTPGKLNNGTTVQLHFRGKRNLAAIIDDLTTRHGLGDATEVLLSGGSAGGLSTYLHADAVKAMLPASVRRYKAVPVSGFFMLADDASGYPWYPSEMRYVYTMMNSSAGVSQKCLAAHDSSSQWQCIFAQNAYAVADTPILVLNSVLDAWQMTNILAPAANVSSTWSACVREGDFEKCTAEEAAVLKQYAATMVATLQHTPKFTAPGSGAFLYTCRTHVSAQSKGWTDIKAQDGTVMADAVAAWWSDDTTAPAASHTYLPCTLDSKAPWQCNPTCASVTAECGVPALWA